MKKINIGLLGLGNHAKKIWLPTLLESKVFNLVACSSHYLNEFSNLPTQIETFSSHHELLSYKNLDAVLVSTKNSTHAEFVIKALEENKHVLCEKPLCFEISSANQINMALEKSKKILCTGFMYRLHPQWAFIKETLANSNFEDLQISGSFQYSTNSKKNVRYQANEGGIIADALCYFLDVFDYLSLGTPKILSKFIRKNENGTPLLSSINLLFENKTTANISISMIQSNYQRLTISSSQMLFDLEAPFILPLGKKARIHTSNLNKKQSIEFPAFNCYDSLLNEFYLSIKENTLSNKLTDGLNNSINLSEFLS